MDTTLVLGIGIAIIFMNFQDIKSDKEKVVANTVGTQIKQIGEVINRYVSVHYDRLSALSSSSSQTSGPGPRTLVGQKRI